MSRKICEGIIPPDQRNAGTAREGTIPPRKKFGKSTSSQRKKRQQKMTVDEAIKEALKNAPKVKGYTVKQLKEIIDEPWPTTRWHLESVETRPSIFPGVKFHPSEKKKQKESSSGSFLFYKVVVRYNNEPR